MILEHGRGVAIGAGLVLMLSACAPSKPQYNVGDNAGSSSQESPVVSQEVTSETLSSSSQSSVVQPREVQTIDPRALAAGDALTSEQINGGGGVMAFFWNESIPDEVFARMEGRSYGADCTVAREDLRYVRVLHVDAEGVTRVGELVVNRLVADEVTDIFRELYDARYPIRKMHLVDDYGADDAASCSDDNTSAFNFRTIAGTSTLSNHAWGLAIDINTYENPYYIESSGHLWPPEAERYLDRSLDEPYVLHEGDACYEAFVSRGWSWGGSWPNTHDYQHFEKPSVLE